MVARVVVLIVSIAVIAAACGGSGNETATTTSMAMSGDDGHTHEHDPEEGTPAGDPREWVGSPAPTVVLSLNESAGEMVLTIAADGFTFTDAMVTDHVDGEGHAHLFVNGDLRTMIFEPEFTLPPDLLEGHHELHVTLSTNDHLEYSHNAAPIGAVIMVGDGDMGGVHTPPVVPDDAIIETLHGVVLNVDGDLAATRSFTILTPDGEQIIFYPTAEATFHGGPIGHIRDHLLSGEPVLVEYVLLEDGTHAVVGASDH